MKEAIDKILLVKNSLKINANQALFLLAIMDSIYTIDLPSEDLLDLIKREFIRGNRITTETENSIKELFQGVTKSKELKQINATYPKLTKDTGNIVKRLAVPFLGNRLTKTEYDKLAAYCPNNHLMIPYLFMFLQMFPSSDSSKNTAWNKQFGTEWNNVTLRRMSPGTAAKFKQIWKTKDIGLFLLGTYMFIQQSRNSKTGEYFVKKIENYLREYKSWYDEAQDLLNEGKLDNLTAPPKQSHSNTTVI